MAFRYFTPARTAASKVRIKILERDGNGLLLAEYAGYYNYKCHTFTLYPCYNPFALNNGKLRKTEISANLVKFGGA